MLIKIYFQNDDLVVCEKPRGVISQRGLGRNMPDLLCEQLKIGEIYPVHRLDKDTSGVMVFAKTAAARRDLSRQVQNHRFKKEYLALVEGDLPSRGKFEDLLFYDRTRGKSYIVSRRRKGVKEAVLQYETEKSLPGLSLVRIWLFTGRTHQIRAQFAHRKHPVVGDGRYGSKIKVPLRLHCAKISFAYKGEEMTFSSLPDWREL